MLFRSKKSCGKIVSAVIYTITQWFVKKVLSHFFNAKDAKVSQSAQRDRILNFAIFGIRCEKIYLTNHSEDLMVQPRIAQIYTNYGLFNSC